MLMFNVNNHVRRCIHDARPLHLKPQSLPGPS
jgi:hypothetical protein